MCKLQLAEPVSAQSAQGLELPEQIRLSLEQIVGDAREGLLAQAARLAWRCCTSTINTLAARFASSSRARLASSEPALVTISGPAREPQG